MLKFFYGEPSATISVTLIHKLSAEYQFDAVKPGLLIEKISWVVLKTITGNDNVNQQFCKLYNRTREFQTILSSDNTCCWYLLYNTVHQLKCLRNNWTTEKCQKLSFDKNSVPSFLNGKDLYQAEKDTILKTTPLTCSAVYPSKLQQQKGYDVLKVSSDRVITTFKLQGAGDTASFIQLILDW